jgi:DNA-directed RNA polymerase specialized sigma24 family protein
MNFLDTLKPEQKEILILRIWEDLSYKEIAEIT